MDVSAKDWIAENFEQVRRTRPLVHSITNYVVMNVTANALLSIGAAPVMAHAPEEMDEMVALAGALVLNIGTLSSPWIEGMARAAQAARRQGTPVVLDPVGAGATRFRTLTARRLLEEARPAVVRANPSEILALAAEGAGGARGVDAVHPVEAAREAARSLANASACVVAVTGAVDYVTDGHRVFRVSNGHERMSRLTGTGCTASALTGAFLAVCPDPLQAAVSALAVFGLAGERAAVKAAGPGSFQVALLDELSLLDRAAVEAGVRVEES